MANTISLEQLISMCKAQVAVALVLEEDLYLTKLLRQHLTDVEMDNITAEEAFHELACSTIIALVAERIKDPTSQAKLVTDTDLPDVTYALRRLASEQWPSLKDDKKLRELLKSAATRFTSVFVNYCALIHPGQRAAVTILTVTTVSLASAKTVEVEEIIYNDTLRAQVLKRIVTRKHWLEAALERPLREAEWQNLDDSVKASLRGVFERRAQEIWGR